MEPDHAMTLMAYQDYLEAADDDYHLEYEKWKTEHQRLRDLKIELETLLPLGCYFPDSFSPEVQLRSRDICNGILGLKSLLRITWWA